MLYPEESVNGTLTIFGENIETHVSPCVEVSVQYKIKPKAKKVFKFNRTVTYDANYDGKNVNSKIDLGTINNNITSLARSNVRIANYMDGIHLTYFDELNVLPNNSLKSDICDLIKKDYKNNIVDRGETISNCLNEKKMECNKEEMLIEESEALKIHD